MKFPEKCPHCNAVMESPMAFWLTRSELDFDSDDRSHIEDQVYECSNCHTLFRARWELISFVELVEKKV